MVNTEWQNFNGCNLSGKILAAENMWDNFSSIKLANKSWGKKLSGAKTK